jgi:hypothetical protein
LKLFDYGDDQNRSWFQQILEWSRKKISIEDNLDCIILSVNVATTETVVDHTLGRVPRGIIPILQYPNNITEMSWTQEPTNQKLFIKQRVAGKITLLIF